MALSPPISPTEQSVSSLLHLNYITSPVKKKTEWRRLKMFRLRVRTAGSTVLESMSLTWNLKHLFINGCFNWMIPDLCLGNGWKSPFPSIFFNKKSTVPRSTNNASHSCGSKFTWFPLRSNPPEAGCAKERRRKALGGT